MDERNPTSPERDAAQLSLDNPVTRHPKISPPEQDQPEPGLDAKLEPKADHGEDSYVGTGRLKGRRALVTGGDSGIGAAVAIAFAREGADVAIAYLPGEAEDARKVIGHIQDAGRIGVGLPGDLTDRDYRRRLAHEAADALGGLDILVNNAGKQIAIEKLEDLTDEQVDQTFDVNIKAMFTITREALAHLGGMSRFVRGGETVLIKPNLTLWRTADTGVTTPRWGSATSLASSALLVIEILPLATVQRASSVTLSGENGRYESTHESLLSDSQADRCRSRNSMASSLNLSTYNARPWR